MFYYAYGDIIMIRQTRPVARKPALLLCALAVPPCLCFAPRPAPVQQPPTPREAIPTDADVLSVRGVGDKPVTLGMKDLDKLTQHSLKVRDQGGAEHTYAGLLLCDVLKRAGMDFGADLHGRALTKYLLVESVDKYRTVFALPEFDPAFTDRVILVATVCDGKLLTPEQGPLRLIVPDDKRQARWMRQVRRMALVDAVTPEERNKKP